MIYVTGDTHGTDFTRLSMKNWPEQRMLNENDYLIITGDFGIPFGARELDENGNIINRECLYWIKWLREKPYTILFVDGNHDNHDYWNSQSIHSWHGGRVHYLPGGNNKIIHLMRGEVFEIDDKKLFTFGGAASHDVEPDYSCFPKWKGRKEGIDWWRDEVASQNDINRAYTALEKHNYTVDYIITHTPPRSFIEKHIKERLFDDTTAKFLDEIKSKVEYRKWFCGHVHKNIEDTRNHIYSLYRYVYPIYTYNMFDE